MADAVRIVPTPSSDKVISTNPPTTFTQDAPERSTATAPERLPHDHQNTRPGDQRR